MKHTPLFAAHQKLGGRLIEFGGWEMPVQYTGIVDEHLAVRTAAGLFDISHMGEVSVAGPSALDFLNGLLTNDLRKLNVGDAQYTLMCNGTGGVIDDLYVYRLATESFLLIINASRIESDFGWLTAQAAKESGQDRPSLDNLSASTGAVAVQGPSVASFIDRLVADIACGGRPVGKPTDLRKNQVASFCFANTTLHIARTGYTGEDGFEVVASAETIEAVWWKLLELGRPHGLKPAGLGARDTLRTEMAYPLYGHDLDERTTPIEAGLAFFVALDKGDFVGRPVLAEQKANGGGRKLMAFKMAGRSAPPRPLYPIWSSGTDSTRVGQVTSGTQSPSLGIGIGLGYVRPEFARAQTPLEIEIRGRRAPAIVVPKPIYVKPPAA